jgi:hypothetical protein
MAWTKLATLQEVPPGSVIEVERGEDLIAICNVTCPWHMWEFHTGTGACGFNAGLTIPTYPVRVEGSEILVNLA